MPDPQALDSLRALYQEGYKRAPFSNGIQGTHPHYGADPPLVPHPSMFQADPLVVGQPDFARMAQPYIDADPVVKQRLGSMTMGPTAASMDIMMASGMHPGNSGGTTLYGVTRWDDSHNKATVGIQDHGPSENESTVAHELAHVAGNHESKARQADVLAVEGLMRQRPNDRYLPELYQEALRQLKK